MDDMTARVAAAYDAAAPSYERMWAPVLLPLARRLVEPLPLSDARVVVDAATGTGSLLAELATRAPKATVLACDRSLGMLRRVPATATRVQANCAALPLPDASADVVVLAFVLFHLPDPAAALREAARVLRPGGWVATATWAADSHSPYDDILTAELDEAGAPVPPASRSDAGLDNPGDMAALLRAAGFTAAECESGRIDYTPETGDYLAMRMSGGGFATRLAALPPEARDAVVERTRARIDALPPGTADRSPAVLARACR